MEVTNEIESKYCIMDSSDRVWSNFRGDPFGAALVFSGIYYRIGI